MRGEGRLGESGVRVIHLTQATATCCGAGSEGKPFALPTAAGASRPPSETPRFRPWSARAVLP